MPTYEYACRSCGEHLEVVQSFRDDPLTTCPGCQGELRKVFSAAGIIFKGSGWHIKDYATSGSGNSAGSSAGSDGASSTSGSDSTSGGEKRAAASPSSDSSPSSGTSKGGSTTSASSSSSASASAPERKSA
jgi:putative FmdB family regulatory protein